MCVCVVDACTLLLYFGCCIFYFFFVFHSCAEICSFTLPWKLAQSTGNFRTQCAEWSQFALENFFYSEIRLNVKNIRDLGISAGHSVCERYHAV